MLVHFFNSTIYISLLLTNIFRGTCLVFAEEKSKANKNNDMKNSFGAAVIDMQKYFLNQLHGPHFKNK